MRKEERFNRVKGAIIGIAYGDAFGMPVEMWNPEKIRSRFGWVNCFLAGPEDNAISHGLEKGEVTDDTMNSIFVTEMLHEKKGNVDSGLFLKKLRFWAENSVKSTAVIGPSTAKAFELLDAGVPESETGKNGITNGAAMKIIPLGLVAGQKENLDARSLVLEVENLCRPTHNTTEAISGACSIAGAAAMAVRGERDIEKIFSFMQEMADLGAQRGNTVIAASISGRLALGRQFAAEEEPDRVLEKIYRIIGAGLPSSESVPAAGSLFYLAKGNPLACARYAANLGGDTDTIGAMACGICGAYSGAERFPKEEIQLLERVNHISFQNLAELLCV